MSEVLRSSTDHGGATNIDELNRRIRGERIEVADHQVNRADLVVRQILQVLFFRAIRQDAAMDLRMQRLHSAAKHLGASRHRGHITMGDLGFDQCRCGVA